MNYKLIIAMLVMGISANTLAGRPNITDYEIPYIEYTKYPNASIMTTKGITASGEKERKTFQAERIEIGVLKERYDNKYAGFGFFLGASKKGEESKLPGAGEAKLTNQVGIAYTSGIHLSSYVNWSLGIEASSATIKVDGKKENDVGMGLETSLSITPIQEVELGLSLLVSSQYSGGGLQLRVVF